MRIRRRSSNLTALRGTGTWYTGTGPTGGGTGCLHMYFKHYVWRYRTTLSMVAAGEASDKSSPSSISNLLLGFFVDIIISIGGL